jgi:hypothetical protein
MVEFGDAIEFLDGFLELIFVREVDPDLYAFE